VRDENAKYLLCEGRRKKRYVELIVLAFAMVYAKGGYEVDGSGHSKGQCVLNKRRSRGWKMVAMKDARGPKNAEKQGCSRGNAH